MNFQAVHQFRIGNQAADRLAKQGELQKSIIHNDINQFPRYLKGIIRTDKLGLSDFRSQVV